MSIFTGEAPPNVTTTKTTGATAPQYLTDYLTNLSQSGMASLNVPSDQLVAALPQNLQTLYGVAPDVLKRYTGPLTAATQAGEAAAAPVTGEDISQFYDPYQQSVIDEMARQSQLNVQRNLMPQLKGAFVGAGGLGSQRYAGATGQALGDVQANLLGQQANQMSAGYKSALAAAMQQKKQEADAAQALSGIGSAESQAATSGLKSLGDIGAQQLGYEQSKIEAPLTRAQNVAQILRGYTYPTTTTENYTGPWTAYQPSPLSQIAGLSTLLGSGFNSSSGWGNQLTSWLGRIFSGPGSGGSTTSDPLAPWDPNYTSGGLPNTGGTPPGDVSTNPTDVGTISG